MLADDVCVEFYKGLVLGVFLMLLVGAIGAAMRVHRERVELEESTRKWEQQVDKSYELGFKAGTVETLRIIEGLCLPEKKEE